jgi:hypothetical protein
MDMSQGFCIYSFLSLLVGYIAKKSYNFSHTVGLI